MRLGFVRISASLAVVVLMASFQAATGMSAFAAETATFSDVASSLYDFSNQPPLRKLIASGAVVSLGVVYDREVSPPHFKFLVAVPPGSDSTGRHFIELAKSWLPKNFEGFEVAFGGGDKPESPTKDQDISLALKALTDFVATPGLRSLFAKQGWVFMSVSVNFITPPPELDVGLSLGISGRGIFESTLERDIPAVFEGFPVRVNWSGRNFYGTLRSRPGRTRKADIKG